MNYTDIKISSNLDPVLTENARVVLERRYLAKNEKGQIIETPAGLFKRVAGFVASGDLSYGKSIEDANRSADEFYEIMASMKFIPNSPTLMNAGRPLGQLSACFVLPVEDSIDKIFDSIKNMALIHKSGGGTGFSFSKLRPKNDKVKTTAGVSSGPVSFMNIFNTATETIKQGGTRRGANMAILSIDHPDILEFISAKEDTSVLTNFNISVALTDAFMKAVDAGETYPLINPRSGEPVESLNARDVFDLIVKKAWLNGEPGIVFIDRINDKNPLKKIGLIESTNPCVAVDNWIHTSVGPRLVGELIGRKFSARTGGVDFMTSDSGFFRTARKNVYTLHTEEGYSLALTGDHPVQRVVKDSRYSSAVEWARAEQLVKGDKIVINDHKMNPCWPGDGTSEEGYLLAIKYGMSPGNKILTPEIERTSSSFYSGFLRGIFDADGTVASGHTKGASVRLAQSDADRLRTIQRMLLRLGIASKIYFNRRNQGETLLPDSNREYKLYQIKAQHELVISGSNINVFESLIGFTDEDKSLKLKTLLSSLKRKPNREKFFAEFKSLELRGIEDVYDVKVPGFNAFDANGAVVHNCGEQPLLPYESCNLGSINLNGALKKSSSKLEFDFDELKRITGTAVHFLDNIIDLNRYPLDEIKNQTLANRKIGLGVMGFADVLVRLGIAYDSEQSAVLAEKIMSAVQDASKEKSRALAAERGAFPNFHLSDYAQNGEKPLRNATTTTIAPTGTISIIAGCSSGIEPIFALAYVRNVMDNDRLIETNPLFEEAARSAGFFTPEVMDRVADHGSAADVDGVPEGLRKIYVTAHDISPEWHIRIQAAFQKHTDNAVSKTVNFSNSAELSDIEKVYRMAYELDCKGVTVYRDGSRDYQVLQIQSKEKPAELPVLNVKKITPRPRKDVTWGATRKMNTGCGSLYVTINEDSEGLFEVFATMGKSGGCAASQTEAVSRLISLGLRSGLDREMIVKQLKGVRCPNQAWETGGRIYSCADAIAKAIERHSGIVSHSNDESIEPAKEIAETNGRGSDKVMVGVCPDCHGPLEFESGCSVCRACGFSRCG